MYTDQTPDTPARYGRRHVLRLGGALAATLATGACSAGSGEHNAVQQVAAAGKTEQTGRTGEYFLGVEYRRVPRPHPTKEKHVLEVFYYGCPHCYHLEPSLEAWLMHSKPADVTFERMPAVLNNPNWIFFARAYYTAQNLGILDKAHRALFDALHRDRMNLFSVEKLAQFHTRFGVSAEDYEKMFKSFQVDRQVKAAGRLTSDYGVDGVPMIIVNGTWATDVTMAGSREALWKLVNWLTEQPLTT